MVARAFIPQSVVDAWISIEAADVEGDVLTLHDDRRRLRLVPASRFLEVAGGGADVAALVGKVKSEADIRMLGGEAYLSSVILGDVAYDVAPGFLAEPVRPQDGRGLRAALGKAAARA